MQSDSGLLRWLKVPFLYNLFQEAVGAEAARGSFIQNHVRAMPGDKMIDIGCGPAPQALRCLPEVESIGFDTNAQYIASARRTHGSKGTFIIGDTYSLRGDSRFQNADIVIAIGVLHHLDDQDAAHCIRFAYDALKESGRFIFHDPCWIRTKVRFRSTSCLLTAVEIFERNNNTVSLQRKLFKGSTLG